MNPDKLVSCDCCKKMLCPVCGRKVCETIWIYHTRKCEGTPS